MPYFESKAKAIHVPLSSPSMYIIMFCRQTEMSNFTKYTQNHALFQQQNAEITQKDHNKTLGLDHGGECQPEKFTTNVT